MERTFTKKLESLKNAQQSNLYDDLLFTTDSLLTYASRHSTDKHTENLLLFTDERTISQAVWQNSDNNRYHHDSLGVTVFEDGLIVGIHQKNPSEPQRYVVVGINYANYSELRTTRTGSYEHPLNIEHTSLFSRHFELLIARLGLTEALEKARHPES